MNKNLALLILSWQVACLFHEKENEDLLPKSSSATKKESDELDKIHDELTPNESWDDFNKFYAGFNNAVDRTAACINALIAENEEFKRIALNAMIRIAEVSKEDNNENGISPEEKSYIAQVKNALGI